MQAHGLRRGVPRGLQRPVVQPHSASPAAIVPDSDGKAEKWLKLNADFAAQWPNITRKGTPPPDADAWKGVPGKFDKYFSAEPGEGD